MAVTAWRIALDNIVTDMKVKMAVTLEVRLALLERVKEVEVQVWIAWVAVVVAVVVEVVAVVEVQ